MRFTGRCAGCCSRGSWRSDDHHTPQCRHIRTGMSAGRSLSPGVMRPMTQQTTTPANRRLLAGLGALVVFGVLFLLPLWVALTLCTMPCCHHENGSAGAVVSADMAACATECGMRSDDATPAKVVTLAAQNEVHRSSPIAIADHLPAPPPAPAAFQRETHAPPRGADASLHVLNSVFRI